MNAHADTSDREILSTRTINAPRSRVWDAWTIPEQIVQWWGPDGFTNTIHSMDVKPGGVWLFDMHGPDGITYPNKITYEEVVAPERLVYIHGDVGNDADSFHVTVTFEDTDDGKTLLTMRMVFKTAAMRDQVVKEHGAIEGNKQTLNHLEEFLATHQ